jgi:hypothetical protein
MPSLSIWQDSQESKMVNIMYNITRMEQTEFLLQILISNIIMKYEI